MNIKTMTPEALTAALTENREKQAAIFALDAPTIKQVDEVEALVASAAELTAEMEARDNAAAEAGKRFAAAKATFASSDDEKKDDESDSEDSADDSEDAKGKKDKPFAADEDAADEAVEGDDAEGDETADEDAESGDDEAEGDDADAESITASLPIKQPAASVAKRVGRKTKRRPVQASSETVITASAGVEGFETGQRVQGMEGVTKALMSRVKGFPKHNVAAAKAVRASNGGVAQIESKSLVSFGVDAPQAMTAAAIGDDYNAVRAAIKDRGAHALMSGEALTAAGWCAPSTTTYSYIADYVVDGLITVPEVSAPRGGIMLTTGPAKNTQGSALDDFGFTQTEAQAEAGQEKEIETIVCPEFTDHRLDAIGYGVTIPLLTQKAYPELITDSLRLASVMYAHKVNRRVINDIVALSDSRSFAGYGPSFTDTLEAVSLLAIKERRKWNLGENAIMEVKLPVWVMEVFRSDLSRRSAVAFDSVKDAQIMEHFTDRRLAVEFVADWQELGGTNITLPGTFDILVYPNGAVIKAMEDVVNMNAIYDAASLTVNEYLGVFFEQGILVAKAGYGVSKITVGVNTAGEMGALTLVGKGDSAAEGSF